MSLMLHAMLLTMLAPHGCGKGNEQQAGEASEKADPVSTKEFQAKSDKAEEKPEEQVLQVTLIQKPKPKASPAPDAIHDCVGTLWYGGIGIQTDVLHNVVEVGSGYPAERAGIKVGDRLTQDPSFARGTPGTTVTLTLQRGTQVFDVTIVREKVCLKN